MKMSDDFTQTLKSSIFIEQHLNISPCRFNHRGGVGSYFLNRHPRACINPNANRYSFVLTGLPPPVRDLCGDILGLMLQSALTQRAERNSVVKVNIETNGTLTRFRISQKLGCLNRWHRYTQCPPRASRRWICATVASISSVGIGHALHYNGRVSSYRHCTDHDRPSFAV